MKKSKFNFLIIAFFSLGFMLTSCGNKSNTANQKEQTEQQGKEYTSAYVCPMHCKDSGSEQAGNCPVCGMAYVKNEDHEGDGHKH